MTALLHHRLDGREDAPPLILGPSLGTSLAVWEPQVAALARHHRVLRYDLPGHGSSPTAVLPRPEPGRTTVADLARLVLDLADHHGWERFHYVGISLGGGIGAHLAAYHSERVASLALVCSSAWFGEPTAWHERAALVRGEGVESLVASAPARWFADPATARAPRGAALLADLAAVDPAGYAACCDALAGFDLRAELGRIGCPTLVVGGRRDAATPSAHARELADGIPTATLTELAGAAHLAGVERPAALTSALLAHLDTTDSSDTDSSDTGTTDADATNTDATTDADRHAAGMRVRRAVLGDAHVDAAVARTTPFTADFQDLITRYAWGEIWTRPGLDRRARSCVTLTAMVAHGHHEELAMHVRAALTNGLTRDEIKEVLLQTAVYCGVPAANSAFAVAQRVLAELDAASADRTVTVHKGVTA
ncbi:bifunctional 3-oxoadipate enol-lactonase/4-carboxymuconolactone decarboxylase PcaDC [Streptoalloteichus hindustanus]|uniref:3-oxoadipate enol-lactonase / 4-carboxymuconolactone decarboxylase n=1 Tax=Streptoalloteichus hindustanus TaxID=2017 RepID=A0A1M5DRZ8_STRHI|nr:3-oxoadipate enol-lactonase / 4-carboxymuconolactone decarboxylase [Streptoalloteichus hindustanus]